MSKRVKFVLWVIAVGLAVGIYVTTTSQLKQNLESYLSQHLQQPVTIQRVDLTFPPGLYLRGVVVSPGPADAAALSATVREAAVRFSLLALLKSQPPVHLELVGPKISLGQQNVWDWIRLQAGKISAAQRSGQETKLPIGRLRIRDGEISFIDRRVHPEAAWIIQDLRCSVMGQAGGQEYAFSLLGSIGLQGAPAKGAFEIDGKWINPATIQAKVVMRNLALSQLQAYIRPVIGTAPEQGIGQLTSTISVQRGRFTTENQFIAANVVIAKDEMTTLGLSATRLVDLLKDSKGQVHLSFVVAGKIGQQLDWSDLLNSALRKSMQQAITRGIQQVLTDVEQSKPVEELIQKERESLPR